MKIGMIGSHLCTKQMEQRKILARPWQVRSLILAIEIKVCKIFSFTISVIMSFKLEIRISIDRANDIVMV